jgi:hypothetical protein
VHHVRCVWVGSHLQQQQQQEEEEQQQQQQQEQEEGRAPHPLQQNTSSHAYLSVPAMTNVLTGQQQLPGPLHCIHCSGGGGNSSR